ncbi:MAG: serine hydrolase [bacterium]|nr:serine hydrolase [bacterium]
MKLKLTVLTILVALLTALSVYGVYGNPGKKPGSAAPVNLGSFSEKKFNSQAAYILPVTEPNNFPIRHAAVVDPVIAAKSYLLFETKTGKTILSADAKQPLPIASLTKLLTALIVLEDLSMDEILTVDEASRNIDKEGADFYLGEKIYVKDVLGTMLVKSSNDAAVILAKAVEAKSGGKFIDRMNRKAYEIGMINSSFFDPAGLDDSGYSNAEDLLRLVQYSKRHVELWRLLRLPAIEVRSTDGQLVHNFASTNKLFDTFPDLVGGKTGYTDGALGCMILEVKTGNSGSLLAIVIGSSSRFDDARKLIEWGQTAFRWE